MQKNVGNVDKIIRAVVALALILYGAMNYSSAMVISVIALVVALVLIVTIVTGICPLYSVLKVSTLKKEGSENTPSNPNPQA